MGYGGCVKIETTLIQLAEEHLQRMAALPWSSYCAAIVRGKAGETFGCEVDGVYFDVGDQARWLDQPDGDVLLMAHASTEGAHGQAMRVERDTIIRRSD